VPSVVLGVIAVSVGGGPGGNLVFSATQSVKFTGNVYPIWEHGPGASAVPQSLAAFVISSISEVFLIVLYDEDSVDVLQLTVLQLTPLQISYDLHKSSCLWHIHANPVCTHTPKSLKNLRSNSNLPPYFL
jgi:hypothetical protein